MDSLLLQSSNQLEAGSVSNVSEPWIGVTAEVSLTRQTFRCPIKNRAPGLQLTDSVRCLFRVNPRHSPITQVLPALHCVTEVNLPIIARIFVAKSGSGPTFCHYSVGLTQHRLADERHADTLLTSRYRGAKSGAAGADHDHIVLVSRVTVICQIVAHSQSSPKYDVRPAKQRVGAGVDVEVRKHNPKQRVECPFLMLLV